MLSRRHLLTGATLLAASAAIPRAWAQAPTGPSSSIRLPYAPSKNEPHIDAQTMEIHHGKHHAAYVNNLNAALAQNAEVGQDAAPGDAGEPEQGAGVDPHGGAQQRRRACQPHHVLADHGRLGRRALGRGEGRHRPRSRRLRRSSRTISTPPASDSSAPAGSSSRSPATASSPSSRSPTRTRR